VESGASEPLERFLEGVGDLGERVVKVTELASLCKLLFFNMKLKPFLVPSPL